MICVRKRFLSPSSCERVMRFVEGRRFDKTGISAYFAKEQDEKTESTFGSTMENYPPLFLRPGQQYLFNEEQPELSLRWGIFLGRF